MCTLESLLLVGLHLHWFRSEEEAPVFCLPSLHWDYPIRQVATFHL
jgi:hypothetical protein